MFISRLLTIRPYTVSPTFMSLATMRSWYCCCTKQFAIENKQCVPCIVDLYMSIYLSFCHTQIPLVSMSHQLAHDIWSMLYFSCGESSVTMVQKFYVNSPMACRPLPNYCKYIAGSIQESCVALLQISSWRRWAVELGRYVYFIIYSQDYCTKK
jgi:hypothetical protein